MFTVIMYLSDKYLRIQVAWDLFTYVGGEDWKMAPAYLVFLRADT